MSIVATEQLFAEKGWVDPSEVPVDQPGLLKADYIPGGPGFDPLCLKPEDVDYFRILQTKELQNGHLEMLSASGFLEQEAVSGKSIVKSLQLMQIMCHGGKG